jgi:hypothetical protein
MDRWIEKIKRVVKTPLDLLEYSQTINFDKSIRILNLILYNENEYYERQMKKELEKYLKKFEFVSFYFITFRDQEQNIEIENNCFYLKGKEGFIPQCLDKTLIALEYFLNKSFDYIVRSNISTIINFNYFPFKEKLQNIYSGCRLYKLHWKDEKFGIDETNYKDTLFASGVCIIMSCNVANYLLQNKESLDRTIIDDVSIGFILSKKYELIRIDDWIENKIQKNVFMIRNKSKNRYDDIERMKQINL